MVGLIEQLSQVHQQTTDEVLEYICTWIPIDDVAAECEVLVRVFGPIITKLIGNILKKVKDLKMKMSFDEFEFLGKREEKVEMFEYILYEIFELLNSNDFEQI